MKPILFLFLTFLLILFLTGCASETTPTPQIPTLTSTSSPSTPQKPTITPTKTVDKTPSPIPTQIGEIDPQQPIILHGKSYDDMQTVSQPGPLYNGYALRVTGDGLCVLKFTTLNLWLKVYNNSSLQKISVSTDDQDQVVRAQLDENGVLGDFDSANARTEITLPSGVRVNIAGTRFFVVYDPSRAVTSLGNFDGSLAYTAQGATYELPQGTQVDLVGQTQLPSLEIPFTFEEFDQSASQSDSAYDALDILRQENQQPLHGEIAPETQITPTVTPSTLVLYDFVEDAPKARWTNGSTELPFNVDTGELGGVSYQDSFMEDGVTYFRTLFTHPEWREDGMIYGVYTDTVGVAIQEGDRFFARLGFPDGAGAGDVTYEAYFSPADICFNVRRFTTNLAAPTLPIQLFTRTDVFDGSLLTIDEPLDMLAGQKGCFLLAVRAGVTSAQDWATWVEARLEGPAARVPPDSGVPELYNTIFDFIDEAPNAAWSNSNGDSLPFPGKIGTEGYAIYQSTQLEDGNTYKRVLHTHPDRVPFGSIYGFYKGAYDVTIQSGDRFYARIGFTEGGRRSDAEYDVLFSPFCDLNGDSVVSITGREVPYRDTYDGSLIEIVAPLDQFTGQNGCFILAVYGGESEDHDRSAWIEARLERPNVRFVPYDYIMPLELDR